MYLFTEVCHLFISGCDKWVWMYLAAISGRRHSNDTSLIIWRFEGCSMCSYFFMVVNFV